MKRARLIYNPSSGREQIRKNLAYVLERLEEVGHETSAHATTGEGMSVSNELEEKLLKKETKRLLHEKLESVPENYRNVLVAFYIEEKSYQEIAREQMVEVKTIETKLYRARKWVKERWKEEDF